MRITYNPLDDKLLKKIFPMHEPASLTLHEANQPADHDLKFPENEKGCDISLLPKRTPH